MRRKALYSIVQYVPDSGRAEAANIGVVIFCQETKKLSLRLSQTLSRVRKFFGEEGIRRLELSRNAFESFMSTAEMASEPEFRKFVASNANNIKLTVPKLVVLTDSAESKVEEMYLELVGDEDTEPWDVEWIKAIGGEEKASGNLFLGKEKDEYVMLTIAKNALGNFGWFVNGFAIPRMLCPKTKGEVRQLCQMLKIPLKESKDSIGDRMKSMELAEAGPDA